MAHILNQPIENASLYNNDVVDFEVLDNDRSVVSTTDENMMKTFAKNARSYSAQVRNSRHYDWTTKNKSFIELHTDLKKLGVKNNKFFLRIFDRDLIGVDPYAEFLPKDLQAKVFLECLINPYYWLREVHRIPADGTPIEVGGGVRYRIDRNNAAGWYLFLNGINHYRSKPRQQGKTQDCVSQVNYAYHFGNMSSEALFMNKDLEYAVLNLYRLKCQRDMAPHYLQMRMVVDDKGKNQKGADNSKTISNPVNSNAIKTLGKATSKESAVKLGRGATAALLYIDEFDYKPYQVDVLKAAAFAFATASENAKARNNLYGIILSSTPGDLDTRDGKSASDFVDRMLVWDDKMFDSDINFIKKTLSSPAYNGYVYVEHSWKQLKLSMKWYERMCKEVDYDQEVILKDIELKRVHGSNNSPFKRKVLLSLMAGQKEPAVSIDLSKNLSYIHIYRPIQKNIPYVVTVDPAEGLSQNNTAMVVMHPYNHMVMAEFKSPYISQPDMSDLICEFLDQYCPRSMIVVENNRGRELINCLMRSRYANRLYYDDGKIGEVPTTKVDRKGRLKYESTIRRSKGLTTTQSIKNQLFSILENIIAERREIIDTKFLIKDICGLVRQSNGKVVAGGKNDQSIDPEDRNSDDVLLAYLIGMYVILFAPHHVLEEFDIRRGTKTDDPMDYDEEGNLTDRGQLNQMDRMYDMLPPEMQRLVQGAIDEQRMVDPVQDIINNRLQRPDPYGDIDTSYGDKSNQITRNDDAYWNNMFNEMQNQLSGTRNNSSIYSNDNTYLNMFGDDDNWPY